MTSRKVFYMDQLNNGVVVQSLASAGRNAISAGGILFVKIVDGKTYLLLISYQDPNWPLLDDLGGRTEVTDTSIFETIDREVAEETNDIIKVDSQNLECMRVYIPKSKYLCLIVKVDPDAYLDTCVFGTFESTDKIHRTIEWHELTNELKPKLSQRIQHTVIYQALTQLSNKVQ